MNPDPGGRTASDSASTVVELVLLMRNTGRTISDDHWEDIDAAHITVWEKAKSLFQRCEYEYKTRKICIEFDWAPVLVRLRQHFQVMSRVYDPAVKGADKERVRFPRRPIRVKCSVRIQHEKNAKIDPLHVALNYTESFLHDLFLMLNLTAPGCCSMWRTSLTSDRGSGIRNGVELSLSDYPFDNAYMGLYWEKWPAPKMLDLENVAMWYQAARVGANQIPESRAEKVLFALLHICKTETTLDTVIWLFYALETFYDTQPGENRRALTHRIGLVLSPNDKQRSYLKDQLRKLYDIRSGFAHGGREIAHPMNNEVLDRRVEGKFGELMDATEFGFATLLASVQSAIERRCKEFNFKETLIEVPLATSAAKGPRPLLAE